MSASDENWLQSVRLQGRRLVASAGKYADAVDVPGLMSRARAFVAEHPVVTAGAGAAACTIAVPAVVAVTVVAAFLGVFFVGFLFVEGTLLTIGAIFVGSILLGLGFVLLTIAVGVLVVYVGVANSYNLAAGVLNAVWSRLSDGSVGGGANDDDDGGVDNIPPAVADDMASAPMHMHNGGRRGWGHHHHVHHHHPPGPGPRTHGLGPSIIPGGLVHRHLNGFVPNQLPRTVDENPVDEADQRPPTPNKVEGNGVA